MLKASKNNQLKPISSVTFSTLSPALNLKNIAGLASILGVISQTCLLYPSTPRTRPSHSEPPASHRRDMSEMRQTCRAQNTLLWARSASPEAGAFPLGIGESEYIENGLKTKGKGAKWLPWT